MNGKWPSGPEEKKLIHLRRTGTPISEIAKRAGVSESTAREHLNQIGRLEEMIKDLPTYPEQMLKIEGDTVLTSDWHAPYFSMKWLRRMLAVSKRLEVKQLAIVGDLTDLKWISRFMVRDRSSGDLNQEFKVVISLLQVLLRSFDKIYWSRGNHEDRLLHALSGHDVIPALADLVSEHEPGELIITPSSTMLLNSGWRLEHPQSYSRDAARVASQLAAIFHKNVACGHGHFIGYKHDISGRYVGIDLGGMFERAKQEYLHLGGVTTHPRWNPGFWVYHGGKPQPFDSSLINWKDWGVTGEDAETH
jgi:hypothetical protein